MAEFFAIISGLMLLAGGPPYLIDILKHKTKPERATWFIWSLLGIVAFYSQLKLHGAWSLLFVGVDSLGTIGVFALSIHFGVGGLKRIDKIALVIAAVGVAVAVVARQPIIALLGVMLADLSGAVLTIIKTYQAPETETTITWLFVGTASLLGALSVGKWSLGLLLFPLYLTVGNYAVVVAQFLGRLAAKSAITPPSS